MSDIATVEPKAPQVVIDPAAIDRRSGKPKDISRKAKTAIRSLLQGEHKSQNQAAAAVGMSSSRLSELILSPAGRAFIARERAKTISVGSLRAARRLIEMVDASSEHVSLDASKHILAIEGIAPPEKSGINVNISNNIAAGYVIDMTPGKPVIEAESNDATLSVKALHDEQS